LLGQQIGEITGIVTGQRVLDVGEYCPKIEVSILGSGKLKTNRSYRNRLIIACAEKMDPFTVKEKV
jgi:hypothetical protein